MHCIAAKIQFSVYYRATLCIAQTMLS